MNNSTEQFAAHGHAAMDTAAGFKGNICANVMLPASVYESLPAAYIAIGALLVSGAAYIGIGHGDTAAYLGTGLSSIVAGITVKSIRRAGRSRLI